MKQKAAFPYALTARQEKASTYLQRRGTRQSLSREEESKVAIVIAQARQDIIGQLQACDLLPPNLEGKSAAVIYSSSETRVAQAKLLRLGKRLKRAQVPLRESCAIVGVEDIVSELVERTDNKLARRLNRAFPAFAGLDPATRRQIFRQASQVRKRLTSIAYKTGIDWKSLLEAESRVVDAMKTIDEKTALLVDHNISLVIRTAKPFAQRGLQMRDLVQEGVVGLIRAIQLYDHTRGFRLQTYAVWWIRQNIHRAIADQGRTIRIPIHMLEWITKVRQAESHLTRQDGEKPDSKAIARLLSRPLEDVEAALKTVRQPLSLDQPIGGEESTQIVDLIEHPNNNSADRILHQAETKAEIGRLLNKLAPREERVIRMRYGVGFNRVHTLEEIGNLFNISRERIRQIEIRALEKLKTMSDPDALKNLVHRWQQ